LQQASPKLSFDILLAFLQEMNDYDRIIELAPNVYQTCLDAAVNAAEETNAASAWCNKGDT